MKALVKSKPEKGLWVQDIPKPVTGHNDVLIKISKTAICGTDLHIYKWNKWAQQTIPIGLTIGHEYVGHVAEVGSEVTEFKEGDRRITSYNVCYTKLLRYQKIRFRQFIIDFADFGFKKFV